MGTDESPASIGDLLDSLTDEFDYPLTGDPLTILGGAVLVFLTVSGVLGVVLLELPVAVLAAALAPQVVLFGYAVRVLRSTFAGESEAPPFRPLGRVIADGVVGLGVTAVYLLPAILVGALLAVLAGPDVVPPGGSPAELLGGGLAGAFVFRTLASVYVGLALYFASVSLCAYADRGSIRAAFAPPVLAFGIDRRFLVGWIITVFVLGAANAVLVPTFVLLVGFPAAFLVVTLAARVLAATYAVVAEGSVDRTLATDTSENGSESLGETVDS